MNGYSASLAHQAAELPDPDDEDRVLHCDACHEAIPADTPLTIGLLDFEQLCDTCAASDAPAVLSVQQPAQRPHICDHEHLCPTDWHPWPCANAACAGATDLVLCPHHAARPAAAS